MRPPRCVCLVSARLHPEADASLFFIISPSVHPLLLQSYHTCTHRPLVSMLEVLGEGCGFIRNEIITPRQAAWNEITLSLCTTLRAT